MINTAKQLLKNYFGYEDFRKGQEEIITHILNKEDCLAIMPTGAGKSICYQIPALTFEGTTLVISPLISLMKDQVDSLMQNGISATYINSSLTTADYFQAIENAKLGIYKIIYVAPERLNSEIFIDLLNKINISMLAIDEAHCVSQWGHDFRPSYTEIANMILNLKNRPVVTAFTATATELVKNDIINLLKLSNPFIITTGFDRKNLSFSVETPMDKKGFLLDFIEKHKDSSGIIYCLSRKNVDNLYEELLSQGYSVSKYHAGMSDSARSKNQNDFVYDKTSIMVATNAFGMGIDKSNIRYVIHYNMPKDLESYYQEAGRAGRDGADAECILLFNRSDIVSNKFLIEQTNSSSTKLVEYQKLNDMVDYCNTDKCLRKYILEYFGEKTDYDNCNNCSNCNSEIESTDITTDSKKIISCIKRMKERFGIGMVTDVLKGSKTAKIKSMKFDDLSTYGIMSDYSKETIKELISFLVSENYINCVGDKYPILTLNPNCSDVLFNNKQVFIKRKIEKVKTKSSEIEYNPELFGILSSIRRKIAEDLNVPPFVVFSDSTLIEMCLIYPTTLDELYQVSGVGKYKADNYGKFFLNEIHKYVEEHNIQKSTNVIEKISNKKIKIPKEPKSEKEPTKITTYNLYMSGKTIKEIVNLRGLTQPTIEKHLIECYKDGMDIDLEKEVHTQYEKEICNAIHFMKGALLRDIKASLPFEVTYFDINYYIAKNEK
ncbi:MAG: DNA helicase RecQ [Clostridia bacterium]|nr:DNA helicase RecQ [Clostridia bacterium]